MFDEIVDWITQNYSSAKKIVEVGVGHRIEVAERVSQALPQVEVLVTDKDESWVRSRKSQQIKAVADDAMFPSLGLYKEASLLYSLNPPGEILPALENLAKGVGADLLVVPISDERHEFQREKWRKLVINGRVVGWLFQNIADG